MRVKTAVGLTGVVGLPISCTIAYFAIQTGMWDERTNGGLTWISFVSMAVLLLSSFAALFCFLQLTRWPTMDLNRRLWEPIEEKEEVRVVDIDMRAPLPTEPCDGLYGRYLVLKSDGTPVHPSSFYFVLRLDGAQKDPVHMDACHAAAWAYAQMVSGTHLDQVGADLMERVSSIPAATLIEKIKGE